MSSETFDHATAIDVPRSLRPATSNAYYRALYRRLLLESASERSVRVVGVTSCRHGAGVSTVASGLAIAAAEDGQAKVLLVDASPEAPVDYPIFALDQALRVHNVEQAAAALEQVLQPSYLEKLWVLPLGTAFNGSPKSKSKTTIRELLSNLLQEFSFIVVDMVPVDQLGRGVQITSAVDGIVLVVDAEHTLRSQARAATGALARARLLGAVVNKRSETE
ncbi:MAG: cellulose synthase operon protein YhjQ/BcsQ [Pirellulales bacterium]